MGWSQRARLAWQTRSLRSCATQRYIAIGTGLNKDCRIVRGTLTPMYGTISRCSPFVYPRLGLGRELYSIRRQAFERFETICRTPRLATESAWCSLDALVLKSLRLAGSAGGNILGHTISELSPSTVE